MLISHTILVALYWILEKGLIYSKLVIRILHKRWWSVLWDTTFWFNAEPLLTIITNVFTCVIALITALYTNINCLDNRLHLTRLYSLAFCVQGNNTNWSVYNFTPVSIHQTNMNLNLNLCLEKYCVYTYNIAVGRLRFLLLNLCI